MTNIQPFDQSDIDVLFEIELACHQFPWTKKIFSSCIGGRYLTFQAINNEQAVGFYVADTVADEATLLDICVHPQHQGQGQAKQLLHHFIAQARQKNVAKIWLEVRASNVAAQMLYINNGFMQTGRRTGYYPANIGYEDAIIMCLNVN